MPSERQVFDLSFLPEKDAVYAPSIQDELRTTPASEIDMACRRIMPGHNRSVSISSLMELQKQYGHVMLIAAMVYARSESTGSASLKFLEGVMKRWTNGRRPATAAPQNTPWQPPSTTEFHHLPNVESVPDELRQKYAKVLNG